MPVQKRKERTRAVEALVGPQTMEERIDRFGDLNAEVEKLEGQIENARVKALREKISTLRSEQATIREEIMKVATADLDEEGAFESYGRRFFVKVGKCQLRRTITSMKRLAELVRLDNFFELATFPLAKVDDYLNPQERAEVIDSKHDGPRSFKVKPR